jgi:hypothetical protein
MSEEIKDLAAVIWHRKLPYGGLAGLHISLDANASHAAAELILAAGYRKPRTITSPAQLESLPFGSAVQTSDPSDVVVLRCEGNNFRNQSGYEISATDLWRYGTHPLTVIYEAEPQP